MFPVMQNELVNITNQIEAIRAELYKAPCWKQGSDWYSDRVDALHALIRRKQMIEDAAYQSANLAEAEKLHKLGALRAMAGTPYTLRIVRGMTDAQFGDFAKVAHCKTRKALAQFADRLHENTGRRAA